VLNVTQGNTAAERLYERAGLRFTDDAPVPLRDGSPLRARRMERALWRTAGASPRRSL